MRSRRRSLRHVVPALLVALALAAAALPAGGNPHISMKPGVPLTTQEHPDPSIVSLGPLLYSFGTNHGGNLLPVAWTSDLTTWTARTQYPESWPHWPKGPGRFNDALHPTVPWGINTCTTSPGCTGKTLWAPGVEFVGDRWVAFHAVQVARAGRYSSYGRFEIFGTSSAGVLGDYRAVQKKPIVTSAPKNDPAGVIDPEVFVDPKTQRAYLLFKTEGNTKGRYPAIWSRQLDASGTRFAKGSTARRLLTVTPKRWEGHVVENPSMIRVDGTYVLFYSANQYSTSRYGTGYALCKGPLGPCRKKTKKKPLLASTAGAYGPGGADAVTDPRGRHLLAYHAYPAASKGKGAGGRTPRTAEFRLDGRKVTITQRRVPVSPGAKDGLWYGRAQAGARAFTEVLRPIGGTYTPFVASIDGDDLHDVGLYGAWQRPDAALLSDPSRALPRLVGDAALGQTGTLWPISGDFDGDGRGDVFWYQPGANPRYQDTERYPVNDQLWLSVAGGGWDKRGQGEGKRFLDTDYAQDRAAIPVVGNFDGRPGDEIWWVQPGAGDDEQWSWDPGSGRFSRTVTSIPAPTTTSPAVGDFDGDGVDDVLWYRPGATAAQLWWSGKASQRVSVAVDSTTSTRGRRPIAGDFDGDGRAEVYWYGHGATTDVLWSKLPRSGRPVIDANVRQKDGGYLATVGDFDGDGIDDIHWYG